MQRVEHCEQGVPGVDASPGLQRPEHREQDAAEDDAQPRYAARAAPRGWSSAAGRAAARLPHRGAEAAPLPLRDSGATTLSVASVNMQGPRCGPEAFYVTYWSGILVGPKWQRGCHW